MILQSIITCPKRTCLKRSSLGSQVALQIAHAISYLLLAEADFEDA